MSISNEHWFKKSGCPQVYDKYAPQGIFFEVLLQSIWQSMQTFWISHTSAQLHKLAYHATSLRNLEAAACWEGKSHMYMSNL